MLYWVFDLDYTLYNLSKQELFDYNKLKEDVEVTNYLRKFPLYKCIFTNGTHGHAVKSLQRLNMNNIFHHIEARDTLNGLKENVIVGRLIPAGTGRTFNQIENKAKLLDKEAKVEIEAIQAKKEQESAEIQENS